MFHKTDYRLQMADDFYDVYEHSNPYGYFNGYYVKTPLGYELMNDSQMERMICARN
jgi:hypothetical protein